MGSPLPLVRASIYMECLEDLTLGTVLTKTRHWLKNIDYNFIV